MDDEAIAETVDYTAVLRLQRAYADVVNRRAWPELETLFAAGARVEIDVQSRPPFEVVGPAVFGSFVAEATERFAFFEFVVLNAHVDLWTGGDHDAATARIFMQEIRVDHVGGRTDAFGLYRDRYRRVDGAWRFADRRYRSLTRTPGFEVFPTPDYS